MHFSDALKVPNAQLCVLRGYGFSVFLWSCCMQEEEGYLLDSCVSKIAIQLIAALSEAPVKK